MSLQDNIKLKRTYDFLVEYVKNNGYPPSVREVCKELNIKSTATVYHHFNELQKQGYLKKAKCKNRALEITKMSSLVGNNFVSIPVVGAITAGIPIEAEENLSDTYNLPEGMFKGHNLFMLNVYGDSMHDAGIYDGDLIVIKKQPLAGNGDIVAAMIDNSATVKRFFKQDKKIILHPENNNYEDIVVDTAEIIGVVVGVIRRY